MVVALVDHRNESSFPYNDVDASCCAIVNGTIDNNDAGDEDWEGNNKKS
jgi:hypothetical protein